MRRRRACTASRILLAAAASPFALTGFGGESLMISVLRGWAAVIIAHLGGLPLEESLIYLVPPIGVVAWIWVLGRRGRDDPPEPDPDDPDERDERDEPDGGEAAPTASRRGDRLA